MPIPARVYEAALEKAQTWKRRPYVAGVGLGQKLSAGTYSNERCVVVIVDHKIPKSEIKEARRGAFPSSIEVQLNGRTYAVGVDVLSLGGASLGTCQGLIGAGVFQQGLLVGGASVSARRPAQSFLLTAGHSVLRPGVAVSVRSLDGAMLEGVSQEVHLGANLDHALLAPSTPLPAKPNSVPGGGAISRVRPITTSLIGLRALLVRPTAGQVVDTMIRHINMPGTFQLRNGSVVTFSNLIYVNPCTWFGDSGTLLFDIAGRAIGSLVGLYANFSCFVPAHPSLLRLQLRLLS